MFRFFGFVGPHLRSYHFQPTDSFRRSEAPDCCSHGQRDATRTATIGITEMAITRNTAVSIFFSLICCGRFKALVHATDDFLCAKVRCEAFVVCFSAQCLQHPKCSNGSCNTGEPLHGAIGVYFKNVILAVHRPFPLAGFCRGLSYGYQARYNTAVMRSQSCEPKSAVIKLCNGSKAAG